MKSQTIWIHLKNSGAHTNTPIMWCDDWWLLNGRPNFGRSGKWCSTTGYNVLNLHPVRKNVLLHKILRWCYLTLRVNKSILSHKLPICRSILLVEFFASYFFPNYFPHTLFNNLQCFTSFFLGEKKHFTTGSDLALSMGSTSVTNMAPFMPFRVILVIGWQHNQCD